MYEYDDLTIKLLARKTYVSFKIAKHFSWSLLHCVNDYPREKIIACVFVIKVRRAFN